MKPSAPEAIRVSILAGDQARAIALAELLESDERIELVDMSAGAVAPDVVIVADAGGRRLPPGANLVFLVESEPQSFPAAGRAWLPAHVTAGELIAAVHAAAQDLAVLTPDQARRRLPGHQRANSYASSEFFEPLTAREQQVLRMLAEGLGNKEIAGQLGISNHTAKFHVAQILAKLNAGSRAEAVAIAIRRGLVPI